MNIHAEREYKVDVAGVTYGMDRIESGQIIQSLFDVPGIGNTVCAQLTMVFRPEAEPPRMAEVRPFVRDVGQEEWTPLGVFWIDQRTEMNGRLEITAYDAMLKSAREWVPDQSLAFPMTMERASRVIAALMDTELDERCVFNSSYTIDYPANVYTMRDVLGYIAAAHGGNWIVTAAGKLLLVPLYGSMPDETGYLVETDGGAITFAGVKILV